MKRYLTLLRLVPILVLLAVVSASANRELGNYQVVQTVKSAYPSVSGTEFGTASSGEISQIYDIGFDFLMDSVTASSHTATRFQVHTNGTLFLLNSSATALAANASLTGTPRVIAPFSSDSLKSKPGYKLIGNAPNRVLVVYWKEMQSKVAGAPATNAEMQVRIYETSNKIEIIYGPNMTLLPRTGTHNVLNAYLLMTGRLTNSAARRRNMKPTATGPEHVEISAASWTKQISATELDYLTAGKTYSFYRATTADEIYPVSMVYSKTGNYTTPNTKPGASINGIRPATIQTVEYSIVGPMSSANPTAVYTAKTATNETIIPITSTPANTKMYFTNATGIAAGANGALVYSAMTPGVYTVNMRITDTNEVYDYAHTIDVVLDKDISLTQVSSPAINTKYPVSDAGIPVNFQVKNNGANQVENFTANVKIYFESNPQPIYNQTLEVSPTNLIYGGTHTVNFAPFLSTLGIGKYRVVSTVTLDGDLDLSNNRMPRAEAEEYVFYIANTLDVAVVDVVAPMVKSVLGRPIVPTVLIKNNGLDDIALPVTSNIKITKVSNGQVIADFNQVVESISPFPTGLVTEVTFDESIILTEAGSYRVEFIINAPGDGKTENNSIVKIINVSAGLSGTFTVGTTLPNANYPTIEAAVTDLYLKGLSGPVKLKLIDSSYSISALQNNGPALDLSSAIVGNDATNTIEFTLSDERLAANTPVNVTLNSNNGIGILLGQNTFPADSNAPIHTVYTLKKKMFANAGGYITFDGGAKQNLKFTLVSNSNFRAGIYLGQGASNNTIKNCRVVDYTSNPVDGTVLPGSRYNAATRDFEFEQNTAYSAGIVLKSITPFTQSSYPLVVDNSLSIDTLVNAYNVIENNIIDGFAYGVASMGIGVLQKNSGGALVHTNYYNHDNSFVKNTIKNSKKSGVFLGFEKNSKVEYNRIDSVVSTNNPSYGIALGGERNSGYFPFNTMNILIQGNEISNVISPIMACGMNVISARNEYYNADHNLTLYTPEGDETSIISNNAIWNINSAAYRIGINLTTERGSNIDSPIIVGYKSKNNAIVNNTIRIEEDGIASASINVCINLAQVSNTKVINNALLINDKTYSTGAATLVHLIGQMPEIDNLSFDRNVYYYAANPATDLVRFYETNDKDVIYSNTGEVNEYKILTQWQNWTKQDLQSFWYNFSDELTTNTNKLRILNSPLNSKLYNNGENYNSVPMKNGLTLADYIPGKDIDNATRGVANTKYDIGASEFTGRTYGRDIEVVKISEPATYRSTNGVFNDANYIMTVDTVNIKAIVRNNTSANLAGVRVKAIVTKEANDHSYPSTGANVKEFSAVVDIKGNDFTEVDFKTMGGTESPIPFGPETYEINPSYAVPAQFDSMRTTVTPKYKIEIVVSDPMDQNPSNNTFADEFRFFIKKSVLSLLVSAENTAIKLNEPVAPLTKDLIAGRLNMDNLRRGFDSLRWKQTRIDEGRTHDFDVFDRTAWEPRAVNYNIYKNLFWSDGGDKALTRTEMQDLEKFTANSEGSDIVVAKKNLIYSGEELIRKNIANYKPFINSVFRADSLYPYTPMGLNGTALLPYNNDSIRGVSLARGKAAIIKATGFAGDDLPYPAIMNIVPTGSGLALAAYNYIHKNANITTQNLPTGVTVSAANRNVIYLGQDWRHFAKIDDVLKAILDYCTRNGGKIEPTVVPVELTYFDAFDRNKKVEISWITASEYNSDRFEIERAEETEAGTTAFQTIAIEPAAGNSNSMKNYGPIIDKNVEYGRSYIYRLKSVDVDGESTLSYEVEVAMDNFFGVNPNPASTVSTYTLNVGESQNVEIELYDINGKMVKAIYNGIANGEHTVEINVSDLVNGTYTIVTKTATQIYTSALYVRK